MDWLRDTSGLDESTLLTGLAGLAGVAVTGLIASKLGSGNSNKGSSDEVAGALRGDEERDTLYVYMYDRWRYGPSGSGFCLKLLTFLRLAKMEYKVRPTLSGASGTGKLPYIRYNGRTVTDSALIIRFLQRELGAPDMDAQLNDAARGQAHAARRMVEDGTYFYIVHDRWVSNLRPFAKAMAEPQESSVMRAAMPLAIRYVFGPSVQSMLHAQGTARHAPDQVSRFFEEDVAALSEMLGRDKQFFGGAKPCVADCSVFAMLASSLYAPFPRFKAIIEARPNLVAYCDRVRAQAFPDWDDLSKNTIKG